MNVLMIRAKVRKEAVEEANSAVKEMFAAVEKAQPGGIRYASTRLPDGVTFVALLQVDEGVDNPLPAIPEFREFGERLKGWYAEPPSTETLTVVASYRLFDEAPAASLK